MLVLGVQVLLGFEYRAFLERGFATLPSSAQIAKLVALCLMVVSLILLVMPSARHRLVERGQDSVRVVAFAQLCAAVALLPFATGIALELFVAVRRTAG